MHLPSVTRGSRLGSIALLVVIGARIVRSGPMRILAPVTLASIVRTTLWRRAARSNRRAGHLVSVQHRRVADAVRLRACRPATGLPDRANLSDPRPRHCAMTLPGRCLAICLCAFAAKPASAADPGVAVLFVDTDRVLGTIDEDIYGQFLEHINHSVDDGLFAEQVRGQGFEGTDFTTYWDALGNERRCRPGSGRVFERREEPATRGRGAAGGIQQGRVYLEAGHDLRRLHLAQARRGSGTSVRLCVSLADGEPVVTTRRLTTSGTEWQEVDFCFRARAPTGNASLELSPTGNGAVLLDFVSLMRADARSTACCGPTCWTRSAASARRSFAGPAARSRQPTSGRTGLARGRADVSPERALGRLLGLLRLRHRRVHDALRQLGTEPMVVLPAPDDPASSSTR